MTHSVRKTPKEQFVVSIGDRGRIVFPAALRERLHLTAGDRLVVSVEEDNSLRVASLQQVAENFRGYLRDLVPPECSLTDELIEERRAEARKEAAD